MLPFSPASKPHHLIQFYSSWTPSRAANLRRAAGATLSWGVAIPRRFAHPQQAKQAWHRDRAKGGYKIDDSQFRTFLKEVGRTPEQWDEPTRQIVEDRALRKAQEGHTATLSACLFFYLQQKDFKAIIRLYDRYALGYQEAQNLPESDTGPTHDDVENRIRALLYAITAHAFEGSFADLLQAYLKTGMVEIPFDSRDDYLHFLSPDTLIETKIRAYLADLTSAFFVSNPSSLRCYVNALAKTSSSRSLTRLYEGVLDGITRPKPFIAACPSHQSHLPLAMSEASWASFLAAFNESQRPDLVEKLWEDARALKVKPGQALWTCLLEGFDQLRLSGPALAAWRSMLSDGIQPDALMYRAMISVLFKDRQPRFGLQTLAEFQKHEANFDSAQRMTVYNTVVNGLLRSALLPQAEQLLEMMKASQLLPDVVTFNTFLDHYGRKGDFNGLLGVITKMEEAGVKGDVYTFSTILNALLKAGRKDATNVVLQCMKEQGIQANAVIYSALIDHQLGMQDEGHLLAALSLLDVMEANEKIAPNNVTYTSFLTHLHRGGWMSLEKRQKYREEVLQRMKKRGIRFSLPDYHILLKACFSDRDENRVSNAIGYYQEMRGKKIRMANTTFYIMLAGLVADKEWSTAKEVVGHIALSNIDLSPTLSKIMRVVEESA